MKLKKKEVIYILSNVGRIGELVAQMWRLRNIFTEDKYKLTVICDPIDKNPRTNKTVFNVVMRGVNVIFSNNSNLLSLHGIDRYYPEPVYNSERIYALLHQTNIGNLFAQKNYLKKTKFYFSLTDLEIKRGDHIRKKFGIPKNSPIVTLHVREPGYLSEHTWAEGPRISNSKIENIIPSIAFLISQGFYVVRIGDKSMKRIVNMPPQLIDAPFHHAYSDIVEPYFISQSKFYITCSSGPSALAWGFGTPLLIVNGILDSRITDPENTLMIFKKVYSSQLRRNLTYEEILQSPFSDYSEDSVFLSKAKVEIIDNSAEEILLSVKEMCLRLEGKYNEDELIDQRIRKIQEKVHFFRRKLAPLVFDYSPCLRSLYSYAKISHEFIKDNPDFLGHEWPVIES